MCKISPIRPWPRAVQFCILVFVALYFWAAKKYPGGSNFDPNSVGFDWLRNYWCELLGPIAKNGQPNPARPIASAAMFLIGAALAYFFWEMPKKLPIPAFFSKMTRFSGIVSMVFGMLFLTEWHETATIASGFFGVAAISGLFFGLFKGKNWPLFGLGMASLFCVLLNNFIYFTQILLPVLPVAQKISFAIFLYWAFKMSGSF